MKIPFAKIKLRQHHCIGISVMWLRPATADDVPVPFSFSPFMRALRSNREQHNYGDTCAFSITNSIHSKCFFFVWVAMRCYGFWINFKKKQPTAHIALQHRRCSCLRANTNLFLIFGISFCLCASKHIFHSKIVSSCLSVCRNYAIKTYIQMHRPAESDQKRNYLNASKWRIRWDLRRKRTHVLATRTHVRYICRFTVSFFFFFFLGFALPTVSRKIHTDGAQLFRA